MTDDAAEYLDALRELQGVWARGGAEALPVHGVVFLAERRAVLERGLRILHEICSGPQVTLH